MFNKIIFCIVFLKFMPIFSLDYRYAQVVERSFIRKNIVVYDKEKLVGSILYTMEKQSGKGLKGYISSLEIKPDYQRQGIGTKLMKMADADMKKWNCRSIALEARLGALGFYKKCGFIENKKFEQFDSISASLVSMKSKL